MTARDRVTIITPLHNGARFIERTIRSVQDQTFQDWRHIIINDRSTDGGDEIARKMAQADPRLIVLDSHAPGAATARNCGMKAADTRWIAFLDCDDYWANDKLEVQLGVMKAHQLGFSWSAYSLVDADGKLIRVQDALPHLTSRDLLTKRGVIGCLTAVYDRERLGTMLMPDIRMRQDMCLFAAILDKCAALGFRAEGLATPLAFYQLHDSNMTKNKARAALYQWRAFREVFKLSLARSAVYFFEYAVRSTMERVPVLSPSHSSRKSPNLKAS